MLASPEDRRAIKDSHGKCRSRGLGNHTGNGETASRTFPGQSKYPLACSSSVREINPMKCPESEGKGNSATEVAREDFEDFDYYWQHLRRNSGYCMSVGCIYWNTEVATHSFRGSRRHALHHQWREFEACCLLPTPVGAGIENSEEALREVLKKNPDFFQTAQWQTIRAKASAAEPVALWNFSGPNRCAWRNYYDGEKYEDRFWKDSRQDYYEHFAYRKDPHHPDRHDVGMEFAWLHMKLEISQQEAKDLKRIGYWAKQHGRTVEEERKVKQTEQEEARARMRRFLEAHPRMDFVADTRLPWATVSRALESEWNRIKDLRESVGLERNEQPPRKREWKKQLEVYDAYFPHWLKNRKKIAALPRIWRENLGFREAFKLLQVELLPEVAQFALRLDNQGLKPKGVFRHVEKVLRALEGASYYEALSPELSEETRSNISEKRFFDSPGQSASAVDFDFEAVYEALDGAEVSVEVSRIESGKVEQEILQSWRQHFSIPKPELPPNLAKLSADKRREWFRVARERIEGLWPPVDYDNL